MRRRGHGWRIGAAQEVIVFLCELDADPGVTPEQGDEIARFIHQRGGFSLFVELDERPGQFDPNYATGSWHWKLRQARNDRRNHFFDLLNGREVVS